MSREDERTPSGDGSELGIMVSGRTDPVDGYMAISVAEREAHFATLPVVEIAGLPERVEVRTDGTFYYVKCTSGDIHAINLSHFNDNELLNRVAYYANIV